MDEPETDETGESIDVAALMGFNSFGDQHRGKRRRYDGRTDEAVIDGGPSISSDGKGKGKGNKGHIGSGSNNLPLGHPKSRPRPKSSAAGADGPDGSGPAEDEAAADGEGEGQGEGEGAGKTAAPERSSHVTSLASAYPPAPTSPAGPSLPPKPPARTPGADSQAWELRRGVRLAGGDVAYYDASFVEDPWRALR